MYFTWPDRRLRYDCRGCGACCKGHGIGLDVAGGQLVQLAARRPEIVPFLRRRGAAVTAFNPRDRCWFLADDGLCRVEVEDGRAAKPASCRLFPFNRVFVAGALRVVDFNSVICPLQWAPDGDGVSHAEIEAEIAGIQDPAIVGTPLADPGGHLVEEQAIAARLFDSADLAAAWDAQTDLARPDLAPAFAAFGATFETPADVAPLVALTPSMRFNELFGPRRTRAADLPAMWLAWLGFAALGSRLAARALGLQELTTMWSEQAPLLHAIARWHDVPVLKPGPVDMPTPEVRALAQALVDNKRARAPLGALIARHVPADPIVRVTTVKLADAAIRAAL